MRNMMEEIMSQMRSRQMNGSVAQQDTAQQVPCGCTAARAEAQKAGIVVKVTGRPPEQAARAVGAVRQQPQQYGPRGGFSGGLSGGGRNGAPPELQNGTLIKVERKPVNLMDEILAGLRNRR